MAEFASVTLAPERTLVMVVDMENETSSLGGWRFSSKNAAIIPPIKRLLGRARKNRVPIIWCHSVRNQQEAAVTAFNYDHVLQEGTWESEIVTALAPRPDDIHVYKHSHNIWWQTDLEEKLSNLVKDPTETNIIVTGYAAGGCVHRAVVGFHLRDYWTFVPLDCVDDSEWAKKQFASKDFYNVFPTRSDQLSFGPVPQLLAAEKANYEGSRV